jgi:glycosyltransferase involved in cell wall biosynthesis
LPKITVLYHYYHPDDVVSAQHIADLCEELVARGWEVETWPANRSCHRPREAYGLGEERFKGVLIRRVWRPVLRRESFYGRIATSLWMEASWAWRALVSRKDRSDVFLIGTDPFFAVFLAPWIKWVRPAARTAHWCFDMYPEYPIADGVVGEKSWLVSLLRRMLRGAYAACDLVADLGPCMEGRLKGYGLPQSVTLTPWALEEPAQPLPKDPAEREFVFGKDCDLGLMYSGNMGRAHCYRLTLELARRLRNRPVVFAYSARGRRLEELKAAVTVEDSNIRFVPFAPQGKLNSRLSAPDVHLVALGEGWTGVAVPSKFFGALAAGRPVLFEGGEDSSIARWIRQYRVGWVLTPENIGEVSRELLEFSADDRLKLEMFRRCHQVYQSFFSKKAVMDSWDRELRGLLAAKKNSLKDSAGAGSDMINDSRTANRFS